MKKLLLLCFLVLLVIPLGVADEESPVTQEASMLPNDLEVEEDVDDEYDQLGLPYWLGGRSNKVLVNVDGFGAVGDGVSDETTAFENAWKQACSTPNSVLLVPKGRRYLVNATRFRGPCAGRIVIQIDGTIVAPNDPKDWDPKNQRIWLGFYNLTLAVFQGYGVIDGSGSKWWAASCKKNRTNPCIGAPTAFTIDSSSSVKVKGLTIENSQQMNFVVSRCESVRVTDVKVSCPEDSPNTDGIHITESTDVVLQNCRIGTGDDCISIVSGSSSIRMKNIYCGPGHGISIGSLGKGNSSGIVEKVGLDTALIRSTTNGLRIKTWQGGNGYVRSIRYQNVAMDDVSNPIIIDQFYCDSPTTCQNQTSAVEISKIVFQGITGTSRTKEAIRFACSDTIPCKDIFLKNINLQWKNGPVDTFCNSASGAQTGSVQPSVECLSLLENNKTVLQEREDCITQTDGQYAINRRTMSEPPDDFSNTGGVERET